MTDSLARLRAAGVSVWLDDLSRERLTSGSLAAVVRDKHVSGVTTNPTIFARSIVGGDAYADQIRDLQVRRADSGQALRELTTFDVRWACDVLRPVYDATGGVDGRVSIEVDPRISRDLGQTVAEARALWWLVDRPNLFVKIPAVKQGLPAISACLAAGIFTNRLGRSTSHHSARASATVRCVSWAIRGSTSIDTRPSRPPVAS